MARSSELVRGLSSLAPPSVNIRHHLCVGLVLEDIRLGITNGDRKLVGHERSVRIVGHEVLDLSEQTVAIGVGQNAGAVQRPRKLDQQRLERFDATLKVFVLHDGLLVSGLCVAGNALSMAAQTLAGNDAREAA